MEKVVPRVGIGVIVINAEGKVLLGKRKGSIAPKYSIPGGGLEMGETFEACTIRELKEEMGIDALNPKVIAITNNLETYREEGKHWISVVVLVTKYSGVPRVMEPEKCEEVFWADPRDLPEPHFDASRLAIACYLKSSVYEGLYC